MKIFLDLAFLSLYGSSKSSSYSHPIFQTTFKVLEKKTMKTLFVDIFSIPSVVTKTTLFLMKLSAAFFVFSGQRSTKAKERYLNRTFALF